MTETTVYAHPARVLYQQTPEDATRWLEIVTSRRATDPVVFERRPPFFWPAEISSRRLDAYYTRMDAATTLRNFARAANEGVAFQNSHRWMELPLGQSVEGSVIEAGDEARTLAVFYTIPGLNVNGVDTSHFIDGLRAGIIHDVSVGFYGGRFLCGICGRDMLMDWECMHIPGLSYKVKEPDSDVRTPVLCTATVVDAELSEVSAVYDGATPGAAILKAQREMDAGRLDARQADLLEQRYRVRLVKPAKQYSAGPASTHSASAASTPGGVTLEGQTETAVIETNSASGAGTPDANAASAQGVGAINALETHAAPATATGPGVVTDALAQAVMQARAILQRLGASGDNLLDEVTWVAQRLDELHPLAEDGRQYRQALVDETLAEGVRAMGSQFNAELYRGLLAGATIPQMRRMRDDWRTMGDNQFAGGPVVRSANEPPEPKSEAPAIAKRAYQ